MNENDDFKELWVDKYRPSKLEDYVLNDSIKTYFQNMVSSKNLQNFSVVGIAGSGKTTLAKIIANEFDTETLFIKCATEGTVDVIRTKIEPFCNALSINGRPKLVILDEIDSASSGPGNSFQMALRTLIEAAQDDTRFILTCNFSNKVIPALLSRCPIIPLKFDKKDLLVYLKKLLDTEKVSYDKDSLKSFIEESFVFYPDCRRILNYLQLCCNSGRLVVQLNKVASEDKNKFLEVFMQKLNTNINIMDLRSFYLQNKSSIDDYKIFAGEIFDYAIDKQIVVDPSSILKMSDIIYQMNMVVNPEIQFFALICLILDECNKREVEL